MITERVSLALPLTCIAVLFAQPALAHSGPHGEVGLLSALQHMAQSPFHMMLAGLAGCFALLVLWRLRQKNRKNATAVQNHSR